MIPNNSNRDYPEKKYGLKYDTSSINLKLSAEEQIDEEEIKKDKFIKEIQRNADKDFFIKKWVSEGLYRYYNIKSKEDKSQNNEILF